MTAADLDSLDTRVLALESPNIVTTVFTGTLPATPNFWAQFSGTGLDKADVFGATVVLAGTAGRPGNYFLDPGGDGMAIRYEIVDGGVWFRWSEASETSSLLGGQATIVLVHDGAAVPNPVTDLGTAGTCCYP